MPWGRGDGAGWRCRWEWDERVATVECFLLRVCLDGMDARGQALPFAKGFPIIFVIWLQVRLLYRSVYTSYKLHRTS